MQPPAFIAKIFFNAAISLVFFAASAQDAKYFWDKGEGFFLKKKYDDAIINYSIAIQKNPTYSEAYASRGFAYVMKTKFADKAINDLTVAIRLSPDSSNFYFRRAQAYTQKKLFDSAVYDYTNAIRAENSIPARDSESLIVYHISRGDIFTQKQRYDSAILDFSNAIGLDINSTDTIMSGTSYLRRFKAYYNNNQIDSALQDINAVIDLNPKFPGNYNNRGLCYNSLGKYELAVQDFLTSLVNKSTTGNPYINIISPLARLKRFNEAALFHNLYHKNKIDYKLTAFLYDVKDSLKYNFYQYFVNAVIHVSENKLAEALANLDTASKTYGSGIKNETKRLYMDILFLNGYVLEKLNRFDEARVNYEQSLVIDSRQPDIQEALLALQDKKIVFRNNDRTPPEFEELSVSEVVKFDNQDNRAFGVVSDSIKFRISGKAKDDSGIDSVKVNKIPVDKLELDGVFFTTLSVKTGTSSLVIDVTDKEKNTKSYTHKLAGANANVQQAPVQQEPEGMGKFYAILIAEKDYLDSNFKDLQYPVRDANSLKEVLLSKYTFEEKNIDTLYNRSREDILETIIARCKALGKNDNLLIFYAGHGDTTINIKGDVDGYLIPVSAVSSKTSYYITSEEINKAILNSHAKHILIMLDACFSGSFTREKGNDINGDEIKQWELPSRKIMTSGNLSPVPDKSSFIVYLTEFLKNNTKKYVSTKDIWPFVDTRVRAYISSSKDAKFYDPQYAPVTGVGDLGGSFIFELRK